MPLMAPLAMKTAPHGVRVVATAPIGFLASDQTPQITGSVLQWAVTIRDG